MAFAHAGDTIVVAEAGYYRLGYAVRPVPAIPASVSLGANVKPSFLLNLNGAPLESSRVHRPLLDVNVALVLTLRVLIEAASVEYSGYHYLAAGTAVSLQYAASGDTRAVDLTASVTLEKLS